MGICGPWRGGGDPGREGDLPEWPARSGPGQVWSGLAEHLQQRCCVARATGSKHFILWEGHVYTATFKIDNQQGPTAQYLERCSALCQPRWEGSLERMDTCAPTRMAEPLDHSPEATTAFLTRCTPIQNKKFKVWGKKRKTQPFVLVLLAATPSLALGSRANLLGRTRPSPTAFSPHPSHQPLAPGLLPGHLLAPSDLAPTSPQSPPAQGLWWEGGLRQTLRACGRWGRSGLRAGLGERRTAGACCLLASGPQLTAPSEAGMPHTSGGAVGPPSPPRHQM